MTTALRTPTRVRIVKRGSRVEPPHDPRLGLAQSAQKIDRFIARSDELWSETLGNGDLAKALRLYYRNRLEEELAAVGLEHPIELRLIDIPDSLWFPLVASTTTATGFQRFGERFGSREALDGEGFWSAGSPQATAPKLTLVFTKNRGSHGELRVRVSLNEYRLCEWKLVDLVDEKRWRSVWNRAAKLCLESEPKIDAELRRSHLEHMRRKLGIGEVGSPGRDEEEVMDGMPAH